MIGKILGGRYEIIEQIGGGGMAQVYKAKCNLLKRYVAVKILRSEFLDDEEFIRKFKGIPSCSKPFPSKYFEYIRCWC